VLYQVWHLSDLPVSAREAFAVRSWSLIVAFSTQASSRLRVVFPMISRFFTSTTPQVLDDDGYHELQWISRSRCSSPSASRLKCRRRRAPRADGNRKPETEGKPGCVLIAIFIIAGDSHAS